jgi:uncharacterized protein (DUF362 family)
VGVATLRPRSLLAAGAPDVVDVAGKNPDTLIAAALAALGGIERFVKPGTRVVLKPNGGFPNPPDWGTTTSPEVVAAMARACLAAGAASVTVLEYPISRGRKCLERCGLTRVTELAPGCKLEVLGPDSPFATTAIPGAVACQEVDLTTALKQADLLVSMPTAKHHSGTVVSLGLKNAMGLIKDRPVFHGMDLHQAVADLARVVRPQLTIVDATRALLTNGPAGPGEVVRLDRIVAGTNVVSVDAYSLGLAPFAKRQLTVADVRHIGLAAAAGLGEADVGKLVVKKVTT